MVAFAALTAAGSEPSPEALALLTIVEFSSTIVTVVAGLFGAVVSSWA